MNFRNIPQFTQELGDELSEITAGKLKSQKKYDKKKEKGVKPSRLLPFTWDIRSWQEIELKNKDLTKSFQEANDKGYIEGLFELQSELSKYKKALFTKRRTMATHLLIFMISDELRNKKPYALPVQIMPVSTIRDKLIRKLQVNLKAIMNEMGMTVVGFVTDGEWNSLRTVGTSRPTTLIQLIMHAKKQAGAMQKETLEGYLKPRIKTNTPAPGYLAITQKHTHKAFPPADITPIGVDLYRGMTFQDAMHAHHKRIYKHVPNPLPWVPGSTETSLECMRSIMATYLLREKVQHYRTQGVDFSQHLYIPEIIGGEDFHDREDHGHLFKRIVKCARLALIADCDISRYIEALMDEGTGLTAKALRGTDPQSVPDCERMFSRGVIQFFEMKGYNTDAKFAQLLHNWHKASDGRGITEQDRSRYNKELLNYLLDDWIPMHKQHNDYSQVDVNKPLKGIRGLSRETIVGLTTNISSQEHRRQKPDLPPEHPRASTSDDVECFIALLHHMLGRIFDHKNFLDSYRKIFTEFQKMIDVDLPFYYYNGPQHRYTTDPLPDFNQPSSSGRPERLDRVQYRRVGNIGSSLASRTTMPRHGQRTKRDEFYHKQDPFAPIID